MEGLIWIVFFSPPLLIWAAASTRVRWWLPAVPVAVMGVVAVVAVIRYEPPQPEVEPILDGLEEFLMVVATAWTASAVGLGWAIRLWRSGRPKLGGALAAAVVLPWVALFAGP